MLITRLAHAILMTGITIFVSGAASAAPIQFRGVPLGISVAEFKKLRPSAKCEQPSYADHLRCEEKVARSVDLPLKTDYGSIDYEFSPAGKLKEITFWADYDDEIWVEAAMRRSWGRPNSTTDEDGDPKLTWRRDGAIIRFNPDCEDGAICAVYRLAK